MIILQIDDEIFIGTDGTIFKRLVDIGRDDAILIGRYHKETIMRRVDDIEPSNPLYDELTQLLNRRSMQ